MSARPHRARLMSIAALLIALCSVTAALANHESITVDGNLADLISAIGRNSGATLGGFSAADPLMDVYTTGCRFQNGYDVRNYYVFLDFKNADGSIASNIKLYAGWDVAGVIGDVDGDGNADTFTSSSPGAGGIPGVSQPGCALSDQPGIGPNESYTVEFDFNCDGRTDVRIAIKNNRVIRVLPALADTLVLTGQSAFARNNGFLELRVDNFQNVVPAGTELCRANITLTANAQQDGLAEDRSAPPFSLRIPPSVKVTKTPATQSACPGQAVDWTITVLNDGLCGLESITVNDILDSGLSYVSESSVPAIPVSTGDSRNRQWTFSNLARGASQVINLRARLDATCAAATLQNSVNVDAIDVGGACGPDVHATQSTAASVTCSQPVCTIDTGPTSVCEGSTTTYTSSCPGSCSWSISGNGTIVNRNNCSVTVLAGSPGSFTLTVNCTSAGCTSTCTKNVTVTANPTCTIDTGPATVCEGSTTTYTSSCPGSCSWSISGNGAIVSRNNCSVTVLAGSPGSFTLTVICTSGGCTSTCTKTVQVIANPTCTIDTGPATVCEGSTTTYSSSCPGTCSWSISGNATIVSRNNCSVTVLAGSPGSFTLTVICTSGSCTSTCIKTVQVIANPTCTIDTGPASVCEGSTTTYSSSCPGTCSWSISGNGTIVSRNNCSVTVLAGSPGSFTLTVICTSGSCTSTCTKTVQVIANPACDITGPSPVTAGTTTTYTSSCPGTCEWTISGNGTIVSRNNCSVDVKPGVAGSFTLTVKCTANGCTNTCTKTVIVNPNCVCELDRYPSDPSNPRIAVVFNESEVLRAFDPGPTNCADDRATIKLWYNDEHALTLGVEKVIVKSATGSMSTHICPTITPTPSVPGCVDSPALGFGCTDDPNPDFVGNDVAAGGGRPLWPALFITDLTVNGSDSKVGDWQLGGTGTPPDRVCGMWKSATRTVDKTRTPFKVTVTPGTDPPKNHWAGVPDVPPGGFARLTDQGYGAECVWTIQKLVSAGKLIRGHAYRLQFMVHDGDQNKGGGDVGQGCTTALISPAVLSGSSVQSEAPAEIEAATPSRFTLFQNFPNPFHLSTTIGYALPERSIVRLSVYNILGEEVARLVDGTVNAGHHSVEWNARGKSGRVLAPGMYTYRLQATSVKTAEFHQIRKMVFIK